MCHIYKMEDPLSCHFKNVLFKSQHIKYVMTLWVVSYPENNQWNGKVNLKNSYCFLKHEIWVAKQINSETVKLLIVSKHNINKRFGGLYFTDGGANK